MPCTFRATRLWTLVAAAILAAAAGTALRAVPPGTQPPAALPLSAAI